MTLVRFWVGLAVGLPWPCATTALLARQSMTAVNDTAGSAFGSTTSRTEPVVVEPLRSSEAIAVTK